MGVGVMISGFMGSFGLTNFQVGLGVGWGVVVGVAEGAMVEDGVAGAGVSLGEGVTVGVVSVWAERTCF